MKNRINGYKYFLNEIEDGDIDGAWIKYKGIIGCIIE
jgi:hypothetical protein